MNRQVRCAGVLALAVVLQGYGEPGQADNRAEGERSHHAQPVTGATLRQACETLAAALSAPNTVFTSSTASRGPGNVGGVNPDVPAAWAADRTRPLCAYPRIARYQGGDSERAESFACK